MRLQYEGLHNLCFKCGKYGHKLPNCSLMNRSANEKTGIWQLVAMPIRVQREHVMHQEQEGPKHKFGPWMIAQRNRRRQSRVQPECANVVVSAAKENKDRI